LSHLPEFVARGEYLDGWIIQNCAELLAAEPNRSNPFLFQMFSFGYDAWTAERRVQNEKLLRELGVDLAKLRGMSLEEIDAWLAQQQADPVKEEQMRAFFEAHPDQRANAVAEFERMERDSIKLLER